MKLATAVLGFALVCGIGPVAAAENSQQSKMTDCNQQAGDKKGDDRKAFMKSCLSAKPAEPPKPMTPQERMKQCNSDSAGKTGDDRKAFMSNCLKAK